MYLYIYEKYVHFISDKTYTNMHHIISDAFFSICTYESNDIYIFISCTSRTLCSTFKAYYSLLDTNEEHEDFRTRQRRCTPNAF